MNKQPATIKTSLFRGAFLLSLLGAIVIPIALGQQDASKGNVTKPAARQNVAANTYRTGPPVTEMFSAHPEQPNISRTELSHLITPTNGATGVRSVSILLAPQIPQIVLYDQYNNGSTTASLSATFTDFATFNADLADDFVVPGGQTWNVQSIDADGLYFNGAGPATSWNVFIYADNGGLPGAQVYSTLNQPVVVSNTTFTVSLNPAALLTAGTVLDRDPGQHDLRYARRVGLNRPHGAIQQRGSLAKPGRRLRVVSELNHKTGLYTHCRRTRPGLPDQRNDGGPYTYTYTYADSYSYADTDSAAVHLQRARRVGRLWRPRDELC